MKKPGMKPGCAVLSFCSVRSARRPGRVSQLHLFVNPLRNRVGNDPGFLMNIRRVVVRFNIFIECFMNRFSLGMGMSVWHGLHL